MRLILFLLIIFGFPLSSFANKDFLIIANAPYEQEVVHSLCQNRTIIVLDGAANKLEHLVPHYILGDFDSITPATEEKYRQLSVTFIEAEDQDYTDLEKAILFAKEQGATTISICCALGGERTDHTLGNLSLLKKVYAKECSIILHTPKELIRFLKDETFHFEGKVGAQCAFLGWPRARVTTQGFVWEVEDWDTEIGGPISSCNQLKKSQATITVEGDVLLIYPK